MKINLYAICCLCKQRLGNHSALTKKCPIAKNKTQSFKSFDELKKEKINKGIEKLLE